MGKDRRFNGLRILPMVALAIVTVLCSLFTLSCARMGNPDGGWYDDDPPVVVGSSPVDRATNVKAKKVTIYFNEFVKIEDATNKVIVSPPQLEMPEIKSGGKKVIVELKDTLKENTTYTIDFSDAISDFTEGNPLGNYTFTFSTGEQIDTFEVSGYVLDASNLEPIKGISVGLYDDHADSAFKTKPMMRVSRTDSRGRFVVKGVAPGTYRVYALQDTDGDFMFTQKGEMVAFTHDTFVPSSKPDTRVDTVWRDSLHIDALLTVPYTHFLPDDITLLAFTQVLTDRYVKQMERIEPNKIAMCFSYGDSLLPAVRGLNFDSDSAFVVEANEKRDTIYYWLRDTTLINRDTLEMEVQYRMTDTTGVLINNIDTLEFRPKLSYEKRMKEKKKEIDKWLKTQEKRKKNNQPYDSIYPVKPLEVKYNIPSSPRPGERGFIEMPTPLTVCDTSKIHLYSMIDSVWYQSPMVFRPVKNSLRQYEVLADWRINTEYSFEVDSAAFIDIYGIVADKFKQGIKLKEKDEFSSLQLTVSGLQVVDTTIIVQLLNKSDDPEREVRVRNGKAQFDYLTPGTYFVRAIVDTNGNGVWDTGNYDEDLQPEAVYYYSNSIECKAKWDVSQSWNLTATERFRQKPGEITKQKPDKEKKLKNRNVERAKQLGIEYLKKQGINVGK